MQGHALVIALSRTSEEIEVTDHRGQVSRMSPADSIHLVCDAECYVGTGSKRRVRSIRFIEAPPVILDNGFSGFNRYPLPDLSTMQYQVTKRAA